MGAIVAPLVGGLVADTVGTAVGGGILGTVAGGLAGNLAGGLVGGAMSGGGGSVGGGVGSVGGGVGSVGGGGAVMGREAQIQQTLWNQARANMSTAPIVQQQVAAQQQQQATQTAQTSASMADPFAQQRAFYQNQLLGLTKNPSVFFQSPINQAMNQQGLGMVERSAGARGLLGSGNRLAALMQYGQQQAASQYYPYMNQLAAMAGVTSGSPGAAGQLYQAGMTNAQQAQSAAAMGQSQTLDSIINSNVFGNIFGGNTPQGNSMTNPYGNPITGVYGGSLAYNPVSSPSYGSITDSLINNSYTSPSSYGGSITDSLISGLGF